jgi:hypothetical protein
MELKTIFIIIIILIIILLLFKNKEYGTIGSRFIAKRAMANNARKPKKSSKTQKSPTNKTPPQKPQKPQKSLKSKTTPKTSPITQGGENSNKKNITEKSTIDKTVNKG